MVRYVTSNEIRYLHDQVIKYFGGIYGEHESGLIEFMAEKPKQELFGHELYPDFFMKAAVYFCSFATNQLFCDGNKRTGVLVAEVFLNINGFELTLSDDEMFEIAIKVANKQISNEELSVILKEHSIISESI